MKKCMVIGSINMDMVVGVDVFPRPGETRTGTYFKQVPGGKGANQAVALGRLGAQVRMAGRVGADASGDVYMENFRANAVGTQLVDKIADCPTGTAVIEVDQSGENHIIVVPGANGRCDLAWLSQNIDALMDADIYLLQLEIPHDTVFEVIRRLHAASKTVILDPAPASSIPAEVLRCVDIITPNETELIALTSDLDPAADAVARMKYLRDLGVGVVIAKSGAHGALVMDAQGVFDVEGYKVKAVDTTAAGDTFNAGLAWALAGGNALKKAVQYANAAAAISVTAAGAQGGMPTLERVEEFIKKHQ